ncbi:unnamed protein product [Clavelina lepadiformis]|uniref:E3 ubiquitin-protein ligase n=1 Tax=Clavelina lepadiformis TaxID=159417 RepID=A0ABP0H3H7_CLALP
MSSRCETTLGGSKICESSRHTFTDDKNYQESCYKSRLRPRPTRQTEYFRPSVLKRKIESSEEPRKETQDLKKSLKNQHTKKQDRTVPVKRLRSEASTSTNKKISPRKKERSGKSSVGKAAKLSSSITATVSTRKLASRCTKTNIKKLNTKEKEKNSQPTTSKPQLEDQAEDIQALQKATTSKIHSRFVIGGFGIGQTSEKKNTKGFPETQKLSEIAPGSSQGRVNTRPNLTKHTKTSKVKHLIKVKDTEGHSKSRKRYQSPPNHLNYNRKSAISTGKTGSCASTSRRGRGKSTTTHSHERGDEPAPNPDMSQESANSQEDPQANASQPTLANQNNVDAIAADSSNAEAEGEDPDMSRLQALLEARGLPSHFFGTLGPRVQQILHRSVNSNSNSKAQQFLQGMQATGDESRQLQSVIEMCQLLVMGNEDTLTGFPVKMVVPALITLLKMEHNFDIMNHACRALTYMMEALPRSSVVVVDAVPAFLEKLQSIHCMDVAEQSLTALEMLSRRHGASILRANGLSSCLLYVDFFSLPAQRNALTVAANCCSVLTASDQHADFDMYYESSIPLLVQRLSHHDKKCVESVCLSLARLVDNFQNQSSILQKIASDELLQNFQNLLVITPPVIGSNTFVMVIRTMCLLCSSCPNLATQLVRNNIAETLRYLLCGTSADYDHIELVPRSPQELHEITSLIGELMPRLPLDDPMFNVDRLLKQNAKNHQGGSFPVWQWRTNDGTWSSYSKHDNRMIEEAHRSGDHEASLLVQGRVYILDFNIMQQVNEDTGNSRPIRRQPHKSQGKRTVTKVESASSLSDARVSLIKEDKIIVSEFVRSLFTLLYEVYGSSAGSPAVRHKCLQAVQRMIYYAEPDLLRDVLKNLSVSSHIASMLSSTDLKVVVGALQMAMILMNKLPDVFEIYFLRQGVTHQVEQLLLPGHKVVGIDLIGSPSGEQQRLTPNVTTPVFEGAPSSTEPSPSDTVPGRLSDILRRKYPSRKNTGKRLSSFLTSTPDEANTTPVTTKTSMSNSSKLGSSTSIERVVSPPLTKAKAFAAAMSNLDGSSGISSGAKNKSSGGGVKSATSFFYNFNPTKWGRSSTTGRNSGCTSNSESPNSVNSSASSSSHVARLSRENLALPNLKKRDGNKEYRDLVKQWVRDQAKIFLQNYFYSAVLDNNNMAKNVIMDEEKSLLKKLSDIAQSLSFSDNMERTRESLTSLKGIVTTSDVSSFELQHSGIVTSLLEFLTEGHKSSSKEELLKRRSTSVTTPPMVTRRRSRNDGTVTVQSLGEKLSPVLLETNHIKKTSTANTFSPEYNECSMRCDTIEKETSESVLQSAETSKKQFMKWDRDERLRLFLNVFVGLPLSSFSRTMIMVSELADVESLRNLVYKLNLCINQLEQFAVKSHDLPNTTGRGSQALTFFAKHQLKCQLQRHPDCSKSKQWHGGPVRVDPLALVQAIERYLIARGYGTDVTNSNDKAAAKQSVLMLMADDDSDDEIEVDDDDDDDDYGHMDSQHSFSSGLSSSHTANAAITSHQKRRLELYIGSNKLPYNMTVYQAVKHFSQGQSHSSTSLISSDDRDTDEEVLSVANSGVWNSTHVIYYKLISESDVQSSVSGGTKRGSHKLSPKSSKKGDSMFTTGIVSNCASALDNYLVNSLPSSFITSDPSKEVLCLMRVLFGLTTQWHNLYSLSSLQSNGRLLPLSDFVNTKLATKCNRQLQDPLMIMTGELPPWLSELAHSCPFVLPFEVRQLLFRIVSFDRDRAMQYLIDVGALPDLQSSTSNSVGSSMNHDSGNRFMPKIEKKKCVAKRENLLSQAEQLMQDHGHSRAMLEVQFDGEVGTGLGPTLEFYTLTSHELQRSELSLWRYDEKSSNIESSRERETNSLKKFPKKTSEIVNEEEANFSPTAETTFVHSSVGLYPLPVGRTAKIGVVSKTCAKFRFLGKFLAKALMDSRMIDIPLSSICYKWLLGRDADITWFDLGEVDPIFFMTFNKLRSILHQRMIIERDALSDMDEKISLMTMDGCSLEDLGLDFLLPGFPNIELMKGGSKISLSINNIDKYLNLIAHWTLIEGVRQQLDAMRDGFQSVFPMQAIDYFFADEMDQLFCGKRYQPWTERELADSCRTDHGYTHESEAVRALFRVLSQYDITEQRAFLQFVTGSPRLPVGGLRALHPSLTIVRKSSEEGHSPDEYLPSVMTCVNYLKLPEYSSETVLRQRLEKAALEGQKSFLLS